MFVRHVCLLQFIIMFLLGGIFDVEKLTGLEWGLSILIGVGQAPACALAKLLTKPACAVARFFARCAAGLAQGRGDAAVWA